MIEPTAHKIRSQEFQISIDNETEANKFQSAIGLLQETQIVDLLERILNQVEDPKSVYQFSSIALDLGSIPKTNFETHVLMRLEEKLLSFFSANILENGSLRTGKRIELRDQKLEQFKHFLEYGYLNQDLNSLHSPKELLQELIREDEKSIQLLLKELGKKESTRRRMIMQFDEPPLESIVRVVSKEESEHIIAYKQSVLHLQEKKTLVNTNYSSFRNAIWEIILAYLFLDSKSYYNKKSFLFFLINKVAVKYNLKYNTLLQLISNAVSSEKSKGNIIDFKKIVLELEKEEREKQPKTLLVKKSTLVENKAFFKMLNAYFSKGTFSFKVDFYSKEEINQRIFITLKTKDPMLFGYLSKWFANETSKALFMKLLGPASVRELSHVFNVPFVIDGLGLFEALNKHSIESSKHWQQLYAQRHLLILNAYRGKSQSRIQNIDFLLSQLWKQQLNGRNKLIIFLQQTLDNLPLKIKKGVARFLHGIELSQHDSREPKEQYKSTKQISTILKSIVEFTSTHEIETWGTWMDSNLASWLQSTGKATPEFIQKIKEVFENDLSKVVLRNYIEKHFASISSSDDSLKPNPSLYKAKGNKHLIEINQLVLNGLVQEIQQISTQHSIFISWSKKVIEVLKRVSNQYAIDKSQLIFSLIQYASASKKPELEKLLIQLEQSTDFASLIEIEKKQNRLRAKRETVNFILKKGTYPWWMENYSTQQFNLDFAKLWETDHFRQEVLEIIQHQGTEINLGELLNSENQSLLWSLKFQDQALSSLILNSKKNHKSSILKLYELFEFKFTGIDLVKNDELIELKKNVFELLLRQSNPTISDLMQLIKNWVSAIPKLQNQIILEQITTTLLDSSQHSVSARQEIAKLFPYKPRSGTDSTIHALTNVISRYFKVQPHQEITTKTLAEQVVFILKHDVKQIMHWLTFSEFRKSILDDLELSTATTLVRFCLPLPQQSYFNTTTDVLDQIQLLSDGQKGQIKKQLFQFLLLKISLGTIDDWNHEHWARLILQVIENVVERKTAVAIQLELNEKILIKTDNAEVIQFKMVNHMQKRLKEESDPLKLKKPNPKIPATIPEEKEDKKAYKKLGEEEVKELLHPLFIDNAGLIILAPFLGMLFQKCGLVQGNAWINDEAHHKAAHLLQYAAVGNAEKEDPGWVINKVLCGIPISFPIDKNIKLSQEDKDTVDSMLQAIRQQWSALKGTSIAGLRTSFLQRLAKIEEEEEQYYMIVEAQAYDMLLDQIPWNITKIKLSWMNKLLQVQWRA